MKFGNKKIPEKVIVLQLLLLAAFVFAVYRFVLSIISFVKEGKEAGIGGVEIQGILISALLFVFVTVIIIFVRLVGLESERFETRMNETVSDSRKEIKKSLSIIRALSSNYNAVYYVDTVSGDVEFLQIGARIQSYMGETYKLKMSIQEYAGAYAEKLVYPEYRDEFVRQLEPANLREMLKDKPYYTYNYVGDKNGLPCYFQMKATKIGDDDTKLVIGFADIDMECREDEENKRIMKAALAEIEEASKVKSRFLTNISHDLLTPLNAISGFSAIASMDVSDEDTVKDSLHSIEEATRNMSYLVQSILDLSVMENGQLELQEVPCDLADAFREVKTVIRAAAKEKDINFEATTDTPDRKVICDINRVTRMFMNLLGNAIKFTEKGGTVRCDIRETANDGRMASYEVVVSDTGIGMSEEYLGHLFEMFSKERTSTESGISGCGVGMTITKQIVDKMGGTIRVKSKKGEGTVFTVNLSARLQKYQD